MCFLSLGSGHPGRFDILDVLEHEFDGIHGRLARDEDHCMDVYILQRNNDHPLGGATPGAPHGVLVWQFAVRSAAETQIYKNQARGVLLTEYLLFTWTLDRGKFLRKLFL